MNKFICWFLLLGSLYLASDAQSITASTPLGNLTGSVNRNNVATFLGVPYAHPPVQSLRFQLPQSPFNWESVWDATKYAAACHQEIRTTNALQMIRDGQEESEDCLYLDIYVDGGKIDPNAKMPVVVFIHGGSFTVGSSSTYDYSYLVKNRGIVAVAIQYRLGLLGFAKTSDDETIPGNLGLHDQVAAIKWVKKHIKHFGGDPDSITLQGESAGSISIAFHMFSPLMKDTFHRGILESGAVETLRLMDGDVLEQSMNELVDNVHCRKVNGNPFECLKYVPIKLLKRCQSNFKSRGISFTPTLDSRYFGGKHPVDMEKAGHFSNNLDAVLIGHNGNEGAMFLTLLSPQIFPFERKPFLSHIMKWQMQVGVPFMPKQNQALMNVLIDRTFENRWLMSTVEVANKMGQVAGDMMFACPNQQMSKAILKFNPETKLYYYHFIARPELKIKNFWPYIDEAIHAEELQFVFGKPMEDPSSYTASEMQFSTQIMDDWAQFVKTGKVQSKNWLPSAITDGNVQFNHLRFTNSTKIEPKFGFPENICKTLPKVYK